MTTRSLQPGHSFDELCKIIAKLRDPRDGCPWDLKQTHESLAQYLIEECYEAVDAIESGGEQLADELGDILLQVLLHSQIASEGQSFDINLVIKRISEKMIRRHPHVFGDRSAETEDEVLETWEEMKQKERGSQRTNEAKVPKHLPALARAQKIGKTLEKSMRDSDQVRIRSLTESEKLGQPSEEMIGELLWQITALAADNKIDAETALRKHVSKIEHSNAASAATKH